MVMTFQSEFRDIVEMTRRIDSYGIHNGVNWFSLAVTTNVI